MKPIPDMIAQFKAWGHDPIELGTFTCTLRTAKDRQEPKGKRKAFPPREPVQVSAKGLLYTTRTEKGPLRIDLYLLWPAEHYLPAKRQRFIINGLPDRLGLNSVGHHYQDRDGEYRIDWYCSGWSTDETLERGFAPWGHYIQLAPWTCNTSIEYGERPIPGMYGEDLPIYTERHAQWTPGTP